MNDLIERIFDGFTVNVIYIPVSFLVHNGKETTYITYQGTDCGNSYFADDTLGGYVMHYDFDVYCHKDGAFHGDYYDIIGSLKNILEENGFVWQPSLTSPDLFEPETGFYHKTLNFAIFRQEDIK